MGFQDWFHGCTDALLDWKCLTRPWTDKKSLFLTLPPPNCSLRSTKHLNTSKLLLLTVLWHASFTLSYAVVTDLLPVSALNPQLYGAGLVWVVCKSHQKPDQRDLLDILIDVYSGASPPQLPSLPAGRNRHGRCLKIDFRCLCWDKTTHALDSRLPRHREINSEEVLPPREVPWDGVTVIVLTGWEEYPTSNLAVMVELPSIGAALMILTQPYSLLIDQQWC